MVINEFTDHFCALFEEPLPEDFSPKSLFREIDSWSSMQALVVVAMIDEHYGVLLSAEDLKEAKTVEDLFHLVEQKQSS